MTILYATTWLNNRTTRKTTDRWTTDNNEISDVTDSTSESYCINFMQAKMAIWKARKYEVVLYTYRSKKIQLLCTRVTLRIHLATDNNKKDERICVQREQLSRRSNASNSDVITKWYCYAKWLFKSISLGRQDVICLWHFFLLLIRHWHS